VTPAQARTRGSVHAGRRWVTRRASRFQIQTSTSANRIDDGNVGTRFVNGHALRRKLERLSRFGKSGLLVSFKRGRKLRSTIATLRKPPVAMRFPSGERPNRLNQVDIRDWGQARWTNPQ